MLVCIYAGPLIGNCLLADVSQAAEPVSIIFSSFFNATVQQIMEFNRNKLSELKGHFINDKNESIFFSL